MTATFNYDPYYDDFDEDISDEEIQMPQANGKSKKKESPSLRGTPFLRCGHKRRH